MLNKTVIGLLQQELLELFNSYGLVLKPYQIKQILHGVYQRKVDKFSKLTDLPLKLRYRLEESFTLSPLKLATQQTSQLDGTIRFNFVTEEGYFVPTVFIPKENRKVICVSTQVGCPIRCIFCNSGKERFIRNLTSQEIVTQILQLEREVGKINGVLFMGMGEPLLNFENLTKAIKVLLNPDMFNISKRHITVSTIGMVPQIYRLCEEKFNIKLAISLHSYNDEKRNKLVKNCSYRVKEILESGIFYAIKTNTKLTIEYVLIKGFNDTLEDAKGLVKLLKMATNNKPKLVKINLIPYNVVDKVKNLFPSEKENIENFKNFLLNYGFLTFVRKSYGTDINAACGQLGF